jgi:hypothetical protein
MRHAISVPIAIAVLTAALLAGCGGDDSTSSPATETTTTGNAGGDASVCATYAFVQAAGEEVEKLNPSDASAAEIKKAVSNLTKSVQALGSAAAKAAGETKADVQSAVDAFQSKLDSAEGQPTAQQIATLGDAFDELQVALKQTVDELKC